MLTFKQFLLEKWSRDEPGPDASLQHKAEINGHQVHIEFTGDPTTRSPRRGAPRRGGEYWIDFKVNNNMTKPAGSGVEGADGHAIMTHVHKVVHQWIKKTKPHVVTLTGATAKHQKAYNTYAHVLAKHFGPADIDQGRNYVAVEFPRHRRTGTN